MELLLSTIFIFFTMRIITSELGRQIDAYTMESESIASIDLMKWVSRLIASCISGVTERNVPCVFLVGPGNRGGIRWYFFMQHMKPEWPLAFLPDLSPGS